MIRTRFAPSPTGLLHVGNVRTGLFAWLFARQAGGTYIIRIEDTDQERSQRQYEDSIYDDLRWLGLTWDEGPDQDGPHGPYRQSERFNIYRERAMQLIEEGRAFWCFCSAEDLEASSEGGDRKYPGTCRDIEPTAAFARRAAGEAAVVRLKVRPGPIRFEDIVHGHMEFDSDVISDPILLRSDGSPTYNYAVVVDDALMEITHVIRGDDHLSNTPKQVLIYEAMHRELPQFAHLSTILGPDHTRLSKRHGATSVAQFRDAGYLPEALMNYIALLGWSPTSEGSEIVPPEALVKQFRLDRVNKSPAVFDVNKLNFINRHYMKTSTLTRPLVEKELMKAGWMPSTEQQLWTDLVMNAALSGVDVVSQIPDATAHLLEYPLENREEMKDTIEDPGGLDLIRAFDVELGQHPSLTFDQYKEIVGRLKQATGRKGKQLFHPLRAALTARSSGPELDKLLPLIETASRLGIRNVLSCKERVSSFLQRYG